MKCKLIQFFIVFKFKKVNQALSAPFDAVQKSLRKNGVAIKGVINVPEQGRSGELLSVNQEFRNKMDLYANVVNVSISIHAFFFSKGQS